MNPYWMAFLLLAALGTACHSKKGKTTTLPSGTVTYIVDGDTFDMADSTGHIIRIRPIGINADEMKDNGHGRKGPFAKPAKDYLAQLIEHKMVRLELDIQQLDKYGRTLAYVYVNDTIFVNAEMVKAGLAVCETVPPNVKYADSLYRLQVEAREAKRGLWANGAANQYR
jgi:micrococcal nuclease